MREGKPFIAEWRMLNAEWLEWSPMFHRMAALAALALVAWGQPSAPPVVDWPPITHETRPWTRWWWLGSAVDEAGLTAELDALRAAGLGGVEITPIYGAAGAESRFVPFLSARWMELLEHTLREAQRVGLGVDMATGTGWPFGGPWVNEADACRSLMFKTWTVDGGARLAEPVRLMQTPLVRALGNQVYEVREIGPGESTPAGTAQQPLLRSGAGAIQIGDLKDPVEANANLQALALEQVRYPKPAPLLALVAYPRSGEPVDLTSQVDAQGTLQWVAPPGAWTLHAAFLGWHGKLVERAAPGGEGNVIDHFSRDAIRHYLAAFDKGFGGSKLPGLRAFFNDSYEVDDATGQADGTPALFEEFQRRRGYDLRAHLPALVENADARVHADYRETVSDLLLETFTSEWSGWSKKRGRIVRNQAHGSPANLLDLYAASDIPETEGNDLPRFKWATSAAHVAGRRLVSAEAATWLGEHFRSTLADVRAAVDKFFVAGVNHIVYHGTAYSPRQEPWPGWQFYASVEFNPRSAWWSDFGALNAYVTRVQSFLQAGEPDQDVLLYYPFHDALRFGPGRLTHFGGASAPNIGSPFEEAAATLQRRGYTYDYISDRQLAGTRVSDGRLRTASGASYETLVVPATRYIPLETFERIIALAREGAQVVVFRRRPADVSGFADLDKRRARFNQLRDQAATLPTVDDLDRFLDLLGTHREPLVDRGLEFVRRRFGAGGDSAGQGRYYFIVNSSGREVRGWIPFDVRATSAVVFDPMSGRRGDARVRSAGWMAEVFLTLAAGESLIVQTGARTGEPYVVREPAGAPIDVHGPWGVRFAAGGPELPAARTIDQLESWTRFDGDEVKRFSGTAVYTVRFPRPGGAADAWRLDLGRVHDSVRVSLNGRDLGTQVGPLFQITLDPAWLAAENRLEVHVTNLPANRIAALDKAGVRWKKFYNVNFPARLPQNRGADGLFTAAKWEPLDSGLLGPVTLTPLRDSISAP